MRAFAAALLAALFTCAAMHAALAEPKDRAQEATDVDLVKRIGSRGAWEAFLKTYPDGPYAERARKELAKVNGAPRRVEKRQRPVEDHGRKTEPNWGDDIFIRRLMEKEPGSSIR